MGQSVRKRYHGAIEFSADNTKSKSLNRGMIFREMYLRLTGQPTITIANNTAAKTLWGDEWSIIKRLRVLANGTDVLFDMTGNALWWLNYFFYGVTPQVSETLGDGATANPAFDTVLILPWWMPQTIRPIDTALDARQLSDLTVEVDWGDYDDINGDASAWTAEPQLEIWAGECYGLPLTTRFASWRRFQIKKTITADNPQFEVDLPLGNVYRGFLLNTTDGGADSGSIINKVTLKSGSLEYEAMDRELYDQVHRLRTGMGRPFGGVSYDDLRKGDANDLAGWLMVDHVMDGYLSEAIDTVGMSEMKIVLDVAVGVGTTVLTVIPQQLIPVRKAA